MKYSLDFLHEGGRWLGNLRSRIQTMFINGEQVIWGSDDKVSHIPTVKEIEELGSCAVAGYHSEVVEPMLETMKDARAVLRGQLKVCRADDKEVLKDCINKLSKRIDNKPEWILQAGQNLNIPLDSTP